MNHTIAQKYGIYANLNPQKVAAILHTQIFGGLAGLALLSGFGLLMGEHPVLNLHANIKKPMVPLILTLSLWILPIFWSLPLISFLTPLIGSLDHSFLLQKILLVVIPILIWILDFRGIKFDGPFCLFAAYTCLSGLRGYWYDFYLMDVGFAAWFYRLTREGGFGQSQLARWLIFLILSVNFTWAYGYKIFSDKQMLSVTVYENFERQGKVPVEQMTDATFGYLGWKLFDHYWHHETITYLANFMCYGRRDRVVIQSELPWRKRFKLNQRPGKLLEEGEASIGYFQLRYRVLDLQGQDQIPFCASQPLNLDRKTYIPKRYPLSVKEWSQWVEDRRNDLAKAFSP